MTDDQSPLLICRAATAAEARPRFLAATFARYRTAEGLDNAALADHLGLSADRFCALALCLRPRPSSFRDDIMALADKMEMNPARLAAVIRQVEVLEALAGETLATESFLAAARDNDTKSEDDTP